MIRFACPKCKKVLQSADNQAGATVACPSCKHKMQVPKPAKAALLQPLSPRLPTAANASAQARVGILEPNQNLPPPRNIPVRQTYRPKGRSRLMPISVAFFILVLIGGILFIVKWRLFTEGESEATAKLATQMPAQKRTLATPNEFPSAPVDKPGDPKKQEPPTKPVIKHPVSETRN